MALFVISGLALVTGIVLFFVARSLSSKVLDVAGTETSDAKSLGELVGAVAKEIGGGSFSQQAELKGRALALEPLRADFSGGDCVWYECTVTREWEEEYWESDKDGNRQRRTRSGSDTVSSVKREPPFALEDASGKVTIDPRGAQVEAEKTWSSFEQNQGGSPLRVGSFVFDAFSMSTGGRRTLGYRFEERSLPAGRDLYVLGEASDASGKLVVGKPAKGRFIVSTRSEEAILAGARTGVLWTRIGAAVAVVAAIACLVAGLLLG